MASKHGSVKKTKGNSPGDERIPTKREHPSRTEEPGGGEPGRASAEGSADGVMREAPPGFPVVGVGASAGGLEAFTRFLQALPVDTGMAFVLVQHLAPEHDSVLAEILSRATSMPVAEVVDEPEVEPNHVYVIPPGRNMVIEANRLRLLPRPAGKQHHPVDQFFRSLAEHQGERSVGVVLSGTASDGTLGLEEIKAAGGITFAQDATAKYDGMPRNARASGCVDFVLSPERIAAEIARIAAHPYVAGSVARDAADRQGGSADKAGLAPCLDVLRETTDVDFGQYKVNTLARRIQRRMVLLKQDGLEDYAHLLRDNPAEVEALYQDILINVTSFFRTPEMFEALAATVIPRLLAERARSDPLRIWVPGCSTGEEAYSLAMTFVEATEAANVRAAVQVFATDLNAAGVEHARAGLYSKERLQDVSGERLSRFFVERDGSFQVSKAIRDVCVFARHNLMVDPPFSRMDLVSCRNLLIYLEPAIQQRVLSFLHYALKPTGFLVLGASETVGQFRESFEVVDGKHKLFTKKPGPRLPILLVAPTGDRRVRTEEALRSQERSTAPTRAGTSTSIDMNRQADGLLLSRFAPPSVLVDENLQILQFRGNVEPYLAPAEGKASHAVLKMARMGLVVPLRALLHRAKKENVPVREEGVRLASSAGTRVIDLEVLPIAGSAGRGGGFLVLFEDAAEARAARARTARKRSMTYLEPSGRESSEAIIARLDHELTGTRECMQALVEQHEAANEELQSTTEEAQSATEEAQSANEELQSINEELETSKEEIQSSNEELTTLNDELQSRNLEMGELNDDLSNLIGSVQMAIVIVGRDQRIRRFSPAAEKLLGLNPADVGRPIAELRMSLLLPDLEALMAEVIETVTACEREIHAGDGRWYSLRVRPYVTLENKIDGAVLVLVDVDALRRARAYAESIVETVREPLLVLDGELRVRSASRAFYDTFHVTREETEGRPVHELGNGQWNIPELRRLMDEIRNEGASFDEFLVDHDFEHLGPRIMLLNARRLADPDESGVAILLGIKDVTEEVKVRARIRHSEERYRRLFEASRDGVLIIDPATRKIVDANPFMTELLGYSTQELLGKELFEIGLLQDEAASQAAFRELQDKGVIRYEDLPLESSTGVRREVEMVSNLYDEEGQPVIQSNIRDITDRKQAEKERAAFQEQLAAELASAQQLQKTSTLLIREGDVASALYGEILGAAVALARSDMATLRMLDHERGALELLAGHGLDPAFAASFERVRMDPGCHYGEVLRAGQRVMIPDLAACEDIVGTALELKRAAGVRAVLCTPLVSRSGKMLGLISNHWREPHQPTERELRLLDVLGRQAADFLERVGLENELRKRVEELDAAHREKNDFIAVLSHELRGPLNAIRGWVQILQHPRTSADDRQKAAEIIDSNSRAQAKLIEDLLDVHRIASGKVRLELTEVGLQAVIETTLASTLPEALAKEIRMEREVDPEPAFVSGDAYRLGQVLGNLLHNAIKFTPRGGQVRVTLRRAVRHAELSVSDTGKGISPTALPHIFERFRQADGLQGRNEGGLGLGLAISKQLVELHGGTLSGRSAGRGKGAVFTVILPLLERGAEVHPGPLTADAAAPGTVSLGGAFVLVVDDEPDARESLRRVLEEAGAEVIAVGSATEALAAIERQRPDVLLSDIAMPGRDGYDLIRSVRAMQSKRGGRIPAIALTAFASREDRERALGAGYQHHLAKPVGRTALLEAVAALVPRASSDGAAPEDGPRP